jgi:hypothetical protein
MVDEKFIINLQGKQFILFEGLLNEFHKNGGKSITTEIISTEPFIVKATAMGEKGTYTGMGDANDENTGKLVSKHKIRLAETRSIARSLRLYNDIGMCSVDELGGEEETPKVNEMKVPVPMICNSCGEKVTEAEQKYSMKFFKNVYCRDCQMQIKESKNE